MVGEKEGERGGEVDEGEWTAVYGKLRRTEERRMGRRIRCSEGREEEDKEEE